MKRYIILILVTLSLFSCEKVDELLTFQIEQTTTATIPAVLYVPIVPIDIPMPAIETNSDDTFENNNTKAEYVKDIKLEKLNMKITDPDGKTFSFLEEIHIYISTTEHNKIELAWTSQIPSDANEIELTTTDKNLDVYIKSKTYNLDIKATVKEILLNDVGLDVSMTFEVTADPLQNN
jgi:hypothetical protein